MLENFAPFLEIAVLITGSAMALSYFFQVKKILKIKKAQSLFKKLGFKEKEIKFSKRL